MESKKHLECLSRVVHEDHYLAGHGIEYYETAP